MENTFLNDRVSGKKYIAFFDLDRTIISENSGRVLIQQAYRKGLISKRYVIWGFYLSLLYKFRLKDPVIIIRTITKWLKGTDEKALNDLAYEIFNTTLKKSVRPEIEERINFHKVSGAAVVILSSSVYPVCKVISDHLKMDDIICSRLESINGVFTGQPNGSFCFSEEKLNRLKLYCETNNTDVESCWYYGDSVDDLPALSLVGNPVCVNPDKKLNEKALKEDWSLLICK